MVEEIELESFPFVALEDIYPEENLNLILPQNLKEDAKTSHRKRGAFAGVYVVCISNLLFSFSQPVCETMWGVIIFLRFGLSVGQAGIFLSLLAVALSSLCVSLTTASLVAVASNGIFGLCKESSHLRQNSLQRCLSDAYKEFGIGHRYVFLFSSDQLTLV